MYYIALDLGTTTIKGVLYDDKGKFIIQSFRSSKTFSEEVDFMEQDPEQILKSAIEVIRELTLYAGEKEEEIGFISLSTYMHSIMAIDKFNNPMTRLYLWSDNRSKGYAKKYKDNNLGLEFYKLTGTPIHPMSPLYKLMWLRDNKPLIFNKAYKFVSLKGYFAYQIINEYIVDYSIASASGIFNIHEFKWDEKILQEIGIREDRLEKPVETTKALTIKNKKFLEETGLSEDTRFVIGASDGCLANLGSHGLNTGTAIVTIGTSGAVRVVEKKPIIDSKARTFSYILADDLYVSGGALNNGGIVFEWLKKIFDKNLDLDKSLFDYKNFNNGLLFLPFLNGERAPYWKPDLRGSYLGLNNSHDREDMVYSTIQGLCFALKDVLDILQTEAKVTSIYANGGFTNSEFWVKKLASILNLDINVLNQGDGACFGAYLLGLKATGKIKTWDECDKYFDKSIIYKSEPNQMDEKMFNIYRESIKANIEIFEQLSKIQTININ